MLLPVATVWLRSPRRLRPALIGRRCCCGCCGDAGGAGAGGLRCGGGFCCGHPVRGEQLTQFGDKGKGAHDGGGVRCDDDGCA